MAILTREELKELVTLATQPCVSLFLPTHRGGPEVAQDRIRLRNLLNQAEDELIASGVRGTEARRVLEPVRGLLDEEPGLWRALSDGLALFAAPGFFRGYRVPLSLHELTVVGERFHIKPLLPILTGDGHYYVLALSQNSVRLFEGSRESVAEVPLENMPVSLRQALRFDDPEKQLQWHVAFDDREGILHGHGHGQAGQPKDYIRRFFNQLDTGLQEMLADSRDPVVLAGVEYLHPIFREVTEHSHVLEEGVEGNPEEWSGKELHKKAWPIVHPYFARGREEAESRISDLLARDSNLASTDIHEIVPAAVYGRVETLFVALDEQLWGSFDAEKNVVEVYDGCRAGAEDLIDTAAAHTLLNGGTVYGMPRGEVPGGAEQSAVLRYEA